MLVCGLVHAVLLARECRQVVYLVYPLFVDQTTCSVMLNVCSAKGKCVGHGVECHEIRDGINV